MRNIKLYILLIVIAGGLLSCKKEVPYAEVGSTEVEIIYTSPLDGETVDGTQEFSVEARIDANAMMSGYRVTITNSNTGEILDEVEDLYEQTQYLVHHHWYPNINEITNVSVIIEALDQQMAILGSSEIKVNLSP